MSDPSLLSQNAVLTAKPVGPADDIDRDLPCVQCGYNLRGLSSASLCPECATVIFHSLKVGLVALARTDLEIWLVATQWCLWVPLLVGITFSLALLSDLFGIGYFLASFFVGVILYLASFVFFVEHVQKSSLATPPSHKRDFWFPVLGTLLLASAIPGAKSGNDVAFVQITSLVLILGPLGSSWKLVCLSRVIRDSVLTARALLAFWSCVVFAGLVNLGLYVAGNKSFGVFPDQLIGGPLPNWVPFVLCVTLALLVIGCLHARLMYRLSFLIRHELRVREGL